MSIHRLTLDKLCNCGTNMVVVHLKSPFIDDFENECPKCQPGFALSILKSSERAAAKAELAAEMEGEE